MTPKDGQFPPFTATCITSNDDDLEADEPNKDMFSSHDDNSNNVRNNVNNNKRILYYTLTSNIFFVLASMLYIWLAVVAMQYEEEIKDIPTEMLQADDDVTWYGVYDYGYQDDYVFAANFTKRRDVYVSRYQILYFAAALCFVITGMMDVLYKPGFYGGVMLLAGSFGLLSAIFVEKDEMLAIVFNSVSVHLFLIEAAALLYWRTTWPGLQTCFLVADALFVIGALIDVVLSYVIVRDHFNHALSRVALMASIFWLITALIYLYTTIYKYKNGGYSDASGNIKDNKELQINKEKPSEVHLTTWAKPDQFTEAETNSDKQSEIIHSESGEI